MSCNPIFSVPVAAILTVSLLAGCGGSDYGSEVRLPPEQQHVLRTGDLSGGPVELPGERGLNIHVSTSQRDRGNEGRAASDSDATAEGTAFCSADVANEGSASANFNIGHRIVHRGAIAHEVSLDIDAALEQQIEASANPTGKTLATAHIDLVVLDGQRRTLAKMVVLNATSDETSATVTTRDHRSLQVRFEPEQVYDIMLFGKVDAMSDAGQFARARLSVTDLGLRLTFRAAETQPAAETPSR